MRLLHQFAAATVLFGVTGTRAYIREQNINPVAFNEANATVAVTFEGYNITESFSNSSEANTPWKAELKIRANVRDDEVLDDFDPDDEFDHYTVRTQVSLTYNLDGDGDVDKPDDSWAFCAAARPLFNLTLEADEDVNANCEGLLSRECIQWMQDYVDDGGPCRSDSSGFATNYILEDLRDGPCSEEYFPPTYDSPFNEPHVPSWSKFRNLTLDGMTTQWRSDTYDDEDDTEQYDEAATRVFVLLASWTQNGNKSNGTDAILSSTLNGTVLCLRPNETAQGSRTLAEIEEDDASILRASYFGVTTLVIATVSTALLTCVF